MADNITWSAIYLGNLPDMDWDGSTQTVEDASPLLTTFGTTTGDALAKRIVDIQSYAGPDDLEVTTNNHPSTDFIRYDLGTGPQDHQIDAGLLVEGTVTFYDGTTFTSNFAVVQDTSGNTFLMILDSQPQLASQGIETVTFTSVVNSDYGGIDQFNKDDLDFICFSAGAMIETSDGPVRMDRLRRGDQVMTLDHGPQPILWIAKRRLDFATRPAPGQPIVIRAGAFGPDRPSSDLMLSPNHRVLVHTTPGFALHEPLGALAPAKALTRAPGIRSAKGRRRITYFSMLLPAHEVVIANGIAVESLYAGPGVFAALTGAERNEWLRINTGSARLTGTAPARLMLSPAETRAGLDEGLVTLPGRAPAPLTWTLTRRETPKPRQASSSASQ